VNNNLENYGIAVASGHDPMKACLLAKLLSLQFTCALLLISLSSLFNFLSSSLLLADSLRHVPDHDGALSTHRDDKLLVRRNRDLSNRLRVSHTLVAGKTLVIAPKFKQFV